MQPLQELMFQSLLFKRICDLFDKRGSCGFNAKHLPDLINIVSRSSGSIYAIYCHYLCKVRACGLDDPLCILLDYCYTLNVGYALYTHVKQLALECEQRLRVRLVWNC